MLRACYVMVMIDKVFQLPFMLPSLIWQCLIFMQYPETLLFTNLDHMLRA